MLNIRDYNIECLYFVALRNILLNKIVLYFRNLRRRKQERVLAVKFINNTLSAKGVKG